MLDAIRSDDPNLSTFAIPASITVTNPAIVTSRLYMAARTSSVIDPYTASPVSHPLNTHLERGFGTVAPQPSNNLLPAGTGSAVTDFGSSDTPTHPSPLAQQSGRFNEEWDASQRGSSIIDSSDNMQRANSVMSQGDTLIPSRGGTLKKKASVKRGASVKRSSSRRNSLAGSMRSMALQPWEGLEQDEMNSAFFSPVPTSGNPTEQLSIRFQGMSLTSHISWAGNLLR